MTDSPRLELLLIVAILIAMAICTFAWWWILTHPPKPRWPRPINRRPYFPTTDADQ